ncbi:MAG: hypothetical protein LLG37_03495 [Spirochaetia bacterium]|nr:hypothetical protein [Spirochaetia bacterium]
MPLIALDILEKKVRELMLIINHLEAENASLKQQLIDRPLQSRQIGQQQPASAEINPQLAYELESLKKTVVKYKNDRNALYTRLSGILRAIDGIIGKE